MFTTTLAPKVGAGPMDIGAVALGLVRRTAGTVLIGGARYAELRRPARTADAMPEAAGFRPGRRPRGHLRVLAGALEPGRRTGEVLPQLGGGLVLLGYAAPFAGAAALAPLGRDVT
jgi:ABC-2 type transport system ATP-binding protein